MFANRLAALRKGSGISQARLADIIGVSQQTIAKWEKQKTEPDIDTIIKLSDLFSVSTDYLLGKDGTDDAGSAESEPATIAAHTDAEITPELEARINQLVKQAIEKYAGKDVKKHDDT